MARLSGKNPVAREEDQAGSLAHFLDDGSQSCLTHLFFFMVLARLCTPNHYVGLHVFEQATHPPNFTTRSNKSRLGIRCSLRIDMGPNIAAGPKHENSHDIPPCVVALVLKHGRHRVHILADGWHPAEAGSHDEGGLDEQVEISNSRFSVAQYTTPAPITWA